MLLVFLFALFVFVCLSGFWVGCNCVLGFDGCVLWGLCGSICYVAHVLLNLWCLRPGVCWWFSFGLVVYCGTCLLCCLLGVGCGIWCLLINSVDDMVCLIVCFAYGGFVLLFCFLVVYLFGLLLVCCCEVGIWLFCVGLWVWWFACGRCSVGGWLIVVGVC